MQSLFADLDWHYMFFGDEPPSFFVEIVIRTLIIYSYTLALLRWIGGRGIGQMSVVEFLLVVALGAAVGDAMFYRDTPLLHALLVITLLCGINKLIDVGMVESALTRRIFSGRTVTVVQDGLINFDTLRKVKVSREELFEGLRTQGIANLGRIDRAYLEAGGTFSVFRVPGTIKGMAIVPPPQILAREEHPRSHAAGEDWICARCATPADAQEPRCPNCGADTVVEAESEEDTGSN